MEYQKENITARERLEEAMVAAFMDRYAQALDAGIDRKIEECASDAFPEELDNRCRALIQREYTKAKRQKHMKRILRALSSAAVVAVVLVGLFSVLFVSVEAFRIPILNFFIEKTDRYWEVSGSRNRIEIPDVFNPEDPLDSVIPDNFILNTISGEWSEGYLSANYNDQGVASISFIAFPADGEVLIDTQGANSKLCKVLDYDAVKSVEDNFVRITWLDADRSLMLTICTINVAEDLVDDFATSTAKLIDETL